MLDAPGVSDFSGKSSLSFYISLVALQIACYKPFFELSHYLATLLSRSVYSLFYISEEEERCFDARLSYDEMITKVSGHWLTLQYK